MTKTFTTECGIWRWPIIFKKHTIHQAQSNHLIRLRLTFLEVQTSKYDDLNNTVRLIAIDLLVQNNKNYAATSYLT